ncbi:MAG: redoxin domain-containing protein, partial [Armatimonadetes bacterium]|nr:redoxin domain-containing protein [Armatimonadota bacterium]
NAYRRDRRALPPHLSSLYPKYVRNKNLFRCPADPPPVDNTLAEARDPRLPVSYLYEMSAHPSPGAGLQLGPHAFPANATWRHHKMAQRINYGDRVPAVRCWHHGETVLNLTLNGRVYRSSGMWELEPDTLPAVLDRMEADLAAGPRSFTRRWSFPMLSRNLRLVSRNERVAQVLEDRQGLSAATRRRMAAGARRLSARSASFPQETRGSLYTVLGSLYALAGQERNAEIAFIKAVQQPGNPTQALGYLTDFYERVGQSRKALAFLDTVNDPRAREFVTFKRIELLARTGQSQRAIGQIQTLLDREPDNTRYMNLMAFTYEAAGNEKKAEEWRLKADKGARLVGQDAPNFTGKDINGEAVQLSDLRGKVVFLNFWASW